MNNLTESDLSEMQLRCDAAEREKNWESVNSDIVFKDMPRLIEEVKRLTAENEQNEKVIKSYRESNLEQATESYELEKENATLKKTLELAENKLAELTPYKSKGGWHDYFIHQAQEQEKSTDYVEKMCCDCAHDTRGFCGDCSENEHCKFKRDDGSCWTNPMQEPMQKQEGEK